MAVTLGSSGLLDQFAGRIHSATDMDRTGQAGARSGPPRRRRFWSAAGAVCGDRGLPASRCCRARRKHVAGYTGGVMSADRLRTHGVTLFGSMSELPDLLFPIP